MLYLRKLKNTHQNYYSSSAQSAQTHLHIEKKQNIADHVVKKMSLI